jgi:hypothetical protein
MRCKQIVVAVIVANATFAATTVTGPTITPSTITFSSPNPDATPTNGSSTATIQWNMQGNPTNLFTLTVQASSSSMTGCPAVPVSAIQVQCTSFTSGAQGASGACNSGSFALSTSPQTIASGAKQGNGQSGGTTVIASFTFTDAWKYPASSSCSLQLTYTVNAQ